MALFKHEANETVAADFVKSFYIRENETYSVKVNWYSISSKRPPRAMNISQRIRIKRADIHKWKPYESHEKRKQGTGLGTMEQSAGTPEAEG